MGPRSARGTLLDHDCCCRVEADVEGTAGEPIQKKAGGFQSGIHVWNTPISPHVPDHKSFDRAKITKERIGNTNGTARFVPTWIYISSIPTRTATDLRPYERHTMVYS